MIDDPIVEEIRHYRAAHAAKYGNNLDQIFKAVKESEAKSKRKFINPGPKRLAVRKQG